MDNRNSKWFGIAASDQKQSLEVERINDAIAEVIFNQDVAGLPVYLDLAEDEVSAICRILGIKSSEFQKHVCDAVINTPKSHDWKKVFREFSWAATQWSNENTPMEVPPTLALLTVLSMAAEGMASETDVSGANYYKRLSGLFDCTGKETELGNLYREDAIQLWSTLRDWLAAWEGERGISTVPIPKNSSRGTKDFKWAIQMPISQARLRDADRQDLHRMFDHYSLDPASNISIEVMSRFLQDWCTSPYSTKNTKKIWKIDDYRETFAAASISELRIWTGRSAGAEGFGVRLLLSLNKSIRLGREFKVNIELLCNPKLETEHVSVDMGSNISIDCNVFQVAKGQFRLADPEVFELGSLISRPLKMSIGTSDIKGVRKPRHVIPMKLDEQQQYVEVDRLSLDGIFGILMLAEVPECDVKTQCEKILTEIARPGWVVISPDDEGVRGLPKGWLFVPDIEVMTVRASEEPIYVALNALLPEAMPSLQLSRGLRIPGRQDRWLISHLPELKVSYPSDEKIFIRLTDEYDNMVKEFHLEQRAEIISLSDLNLTPGRYRITMELSDGTVVGRKALTLVGAATPNAWSALKPISFRYQIGDSASPSAMTAVSNLAVSNGNIIRGFHYEGTPPITGVEIDPPKSAPWNEQFVVDSAEHGIKRSQVSIKTEDPDGCFYTGRHYFLISEIWMGKPQPRGAVLKMRCRTCGVSKIQPAVPANKWALKSAVIKKEPAQERLQPINFDGFPGIPPQVSEKWNLAYEAMCYMRHGKIGDIETIVNQFIDKEDYNVERFTHGLQILGLADLFLDEYFRVQEWSISPACVVMTSETKGFLSGFRSADLLAKIQQRISIVSGSLKPFDNKDLPSSWILEVPSPSAVSQVFEGILDPITKIPIPVVEDMASTIARGVGSISQLFSASPKITIPAYLQLKMWNHKQTKWVNGDDPRAAGAIQYVGYGNKYSFSEAAIDLDGHVISGSVRTVKHKSAQSANAPLVYYDGDSRQFYARLGAELPGLFGRSLVAASGLAPREDLNRRVVIYTGIEPQLARLIYGQLMS